MRACTCVYKRVHACTCVCVCVYSCIYACKNMSVRACEVFLIVMQARNVMSSMGAALLTNGRHIG